MEQAEAVQEEEPLAPVVAEAGPLGVLSVRVVPGVVGVTGVSWSPVVGATAAWWPRSAWTPSSRLGGR